MALDLCLESYTVLVGMVDTGFVGAMDDLRSAVQLRGNRSDTLRLPAVVEVDAFEATPEWRQFNREVQLAADRLVFPQAQAIWLVDVCGYTYDEAARAVRTTPVVVARRVALGRQSIRNSLSAFSG